MYTCGFSWKKLRSCWKNDVTNVVGTLNGCKQTRDHTQRTSRIISRVCDPLPFLSTFGYEILNLSNLPYYVRFWAILPPPPCADSADDLYGLMFPSLLWWNHLCSRKVLAFWFFLLTAMTINQLTISSIHLILAVKWQYNDLFIAASRLDVVYLCLNDFNAQVWILDCKHHRVHRKAISFPTNPRQQNVINFSTCVENNLSTREERSRQSCSWSRFLAVVVGNARIQSLVGSYDKHLNALGNLDFMFDPIFRISDRQTWVLCWRVLSASGSWSSGWRWSTRWNTWVCMQGLLLVPWELQAGIWSLLLPSWLIAGHWMGRRVKVHLIQSCTKWCA